jgi:hypothetical protein
MFWDDNAENANLDGFFNFGFTVPAKIIGDVPVLEAPK